MVSKSSKSTDNNAGAVSISAAAVSISAAAVSISAQKNTAAVASSSTTADNPNVMVSRIVKLAEKLKLNRLGINHDEAASTSSNLVQIVADDDAKHAQAVAKLKLATLYSSITTKLADFGTETKLNSELFLACAESIIEYKKAFEASSDQFNKSVINNPIADDGDSSIKITWLTHAPKSFHNIANLETAINNVKDFIRSNNIVLTRESWFSLNNYPSAVHITLIEACYTELSKNLVSNSNLVTMDRQFSTIEANELDLQFIKIISDLFPTASDVELAEYSSFVVGNCDTPIKILSTIPEFCRYDVQQLFKGGYCSDHTLDVSAAILEQNNLIKVIQPILVTSAASNSLQIIIKSDNSKTLYTDNFTKKIMRILEKQREKFQQVQSNINVLFWSDFMVLTFNWPNSVSNVPMTHRASRKNGTKPNVSHWSYSISQFRTNESYIYDSNKSQLQEEFDLEREVRNTKAKKGSSSSSSSSPINLTKITLTRLEYISIQTMCWVKTFLAHNKKPFNELKWSIKISSTFPQQQDSTSCGLFGLLLYKKIAAMCNLTGNSSATDSESGAISSSLATLENDWVGENDPQQISFLVTLQMARLYAQHSTIARYILSNWINLPNTTQEMPVTVTVEPIQIQGQGSMISTSPAKNLATEIVIPKLPQSIMPVLLESNENQLESEDENAIDKTVKDNLNKKKKRQDVELESQTESTRSKRKRLKDQDSELQNGSSIANQIASTDFVHNLFRLAKQRKFNLALRVISINYGETTDIGIIDVTKTKSRINSWFPKHDQVDSGLDEEELEATSENNRELVIDKQPLQQYKQVQYRANKIKKAKSSLTWDLHFYFAQYNTISEAQIEIKSLKALASPPKGILSACVVFVNLLTPTSDITVTQLQLFSKQVEPDYFCLLDSNQIEEYFRSDSNTQASNSSSSVPQPLAGDAASATGGFAVLLITITPPVNIKELKSKISIVELFQETLKSSNNSAAVKNIVMR